MGGFSTSSHGEHLIRSELWSQQLKDVFYEDLIGWKYIDMITSEFPDGDVLNIPSIGEMEVQDYAEGHQIKYTAMDTGNFPFQITEYKASGTYVYDKFKQDSFYAERVIGQFVPKMNRAIQVQMEIDAMRVGPDNQTASNPNAINGAAHRFVASGTNETMHPRDFARARHALRKANVPMTNLVAIVDPSVEYALSTMTNLTNHITNPNWEGAIGTGLTTGMKFITRIYGFDVYTSDFLKVNTTSETIDLSSLGGTSGTVAAGVNNLFFSVDASPFIGAVRQAPRVESERNKDFQRDEYVVTCRYGLDLYRPEALVVILTDTDQVYAA
jgi:hypothetical protein